MEDPFDLVSKGSLRFCRVRLVVCRVRLVVSRVQGLGCRVH